MPDEMRICVADETDVLTLPYGATCDLAEAIAIACVQLRDGNRVLRPVTTSEASEFLAAAVQAVSIIVRKSRPDAVVDMLPPPPIELPRMRLGRYGWGIWRTGSVGEIHDAVTDSAVEPAE